MHSALTTWLNVSDLLQVPESVCLQSLSYHEAWELSYFGASVLHPRTTMPAMKYSIPISIRNFFNQSSPGVAAQHGRLRVFRGVCSCTHAAQGRKWGLSQ